MEKKYNFVYITTNIIDGKQYIGDHSTDNLNDNYLGGGVYIKNAIKCHGKDNFKREILEYFTTKEDSFKSQEKYINHYVTLYPNGYNLSPKGGSQCKGGVSDETKKLISKNNAKYWLNKNRSEETKLKISENYVGMTGKHHSEETKQKIGNSQKGEKHHNYGNNLSEDHKQKISNSEKGRIPWNKGKKGCFSDETILKLKESHKDQIPWIKGRKHSEETKRKISKGLKKRNFIS
jgi:hypothetical protein